MASGVDSYRNVRAYGNLADASPYQVIQLMLDALLSRIAEATGHIERGEVAAKGEKIGKALGIIEGLLLGLDKERGGDIALNLERLYDYCVAHAAQGQSRKSRRSAEGSQLVVARDQARLGRHRRRGEGLTR